MVTIVGNYRLLLKTKAMQGIITIFKTTNAPLPAQTEPDPDTQEVDDVYKRLSRLQHETEARERFNARRGGLATREAAGPGIPAYRKKLVYSKQGRRPLA
jgi:hypothetical protein